jgi:hypothetical protein
VASKHSGKYHDEFVEAAEFRVRYVLQYIFPVRLKSSAYCRGILQTILAEAFLFIFASQNLKFGE